MFIYSLKIDGCVAYACGFRRSERLQQRNPSYLSIGFLFAPIEMAWNGYKLNCPGLWDRYNAINFRDKQI